MWQTKVDAVVELARQATPTAIAALKRIAADTKAPPSAQVSAAVALLDRGWGRPHQSLDVAVNRSLEDMSDAELLAICQWGGRPEAHHGDVG